MRGLRFALALAVVVLVHATAAQVLPAFNRGVDLFLVLIVLHALPGSSLAGMLGGTAAGLAEDVLSGGAFGLHGFAGTIIGYAAARLSRRLAIQRGPGVFLTVAGAVLVHSLLLLAVSILALPELLLPGPPWLSLRAFLSGLVGVTLHTLGRHFRRALARRRASRGKRLRLG